MLVTSHSELQPLGDRSLVVWHCKDPAQMPTVVCREEVSHAIAVPRVVEVGRQARRGTERGTQVPYLPYIGSSARNRDLLRSCQALIEIGIHCSTLNQTL